MTGHRYLDADGDGKPDLAPVVSTNKDARNRALRTLAFGLLTDVGVAVLLFLLPIFGSASTDWSTLDWRLIGLSLAKTVVMATLSFLARRFKISPRTLTR
jgi:hypothetical protein